MSDTTPGGWPDAARPGVPMNPERDGWHWVRWAGYEPGMEFTAFWSSGGWDDDWAHLAGDRQAHRYIYLGPCHTPAEVAAQIEAARRDEREANAAVVDCGCVGREAVLARLESQNEKRASYLCTHGDVCCAIQAAAIRARGDA